MASEITLTSAQAEVVAAMAADMVREARSGAPTMMAPAWPEPASRLSLHDQAPPTADVPLTREAVPPSSVMAYHVSSNFHSL